MTPKRIAIFFHYDPDGTASAYVSEYLRSLRSVASRVVFVNNGPLDEPSVSRIRSVADDCLIRENSGYDSWAYKHALDYTGRQALSAYDELILCNFTSYAPVGDLISMFKTMDTRSNDFWGVARHPEMPIYFLAPRKLGYCREHIMSYFMVFRRNVFTSSAFSSYWDNLPPISSYYEAVGLHETVFTDYLEKNGFTSDSYVDLAQTESVSSNASVYQADHFLIDLGCPVVKRKAFFHDYCDFYSQSTARQGSKILAHMVETSSYDPAFVWDDLLRTQDIYALMRSLHLRYIIPRDTSAFEATVSTALRNSSLALHIESDLAADSLRTRLEGWGLPGRTDIYFADNDMRARHADSMSAAIGGSSRTQEAPTWIDALRASAKVMGGDDLLCLVSLEPRQDPSGPSLASLSSHLEVLESLLNSPESVAYIHSLFARNERLGLLLPVPPVHAHLDPRGIQLDEPVLEAARSALAKLRVPSSFGSTGQKAHYVKPARCFWIRPTCLTAEDLETLGATSASDSHRQLVSQALLPALVQKNGYYTAMVATDQQTAAYVDNLQYLHEWTIQHNPNPHMLRMLARRVCRKIVREIRSRNYR